MKKLRAVGIAVAAVAIAAPAAGQEITLGGQVRPRFEFRDTLGAGSGAFTSMRVRGQAGVELDRGLAVFIQFQDVRIWGEESGTLTDFSADQLDLHQGYLELKRAGAIDLSVRAGRQELSYGGERLIGSVSWTQQARSFDAVRMRLESDSARADILGAWLGNTEAAGSAEDAYLLAGYGTLRGVGPAALDVYSIYNRAEADSETSQITLGARWHGEFRGFAFRAEGSYQAGRRTDSDVAAFMVGVRLGKTLLGGSATATLWYDYLSGDDDPGDGTLRVFDTLFPTNHRFYGLADHFLNIPVQTADRGLQDLALKTTYTPHRDVRLAADLHSFRLATAEGLRTGHLGEEADLTARYAYSRHFRVTAGFSYLFAARGFAEIGRLADDVSWAYLTLDAAF